MWYLEDSIDIFSLASLWPDSWSLPGASGAAVEWIYSFGEHAQLFHQKNLGDGSKDQK